MSHTAELRAAFEDGCRTGRANPRASNELIAAWSGLHYPDAPLVEPKKTTIWDHSTNSSTRIIAEQRGEHL